MRAVQSISNQRGIFGNHGRACEARLGCRRPRCPARPRSPRYLHRTENVWPRTEGTQISCWAGPCLHIVGTAPRLSRPGSGSRAKPRCQCPASGLCRDSGVCCYDESRNNRVNRFRSAPATPGISHPAHKKIPRSLAGCISKSGFAMRELSQLHLRSGRTLRALLEVERHLLAFSQALEAAA